MRNNITLVLLVIFLFLTVQVVLSVPSIFKIVPAIAVFLLWLQISSMLECRMIRSMFK